MTTKHTPGPWTVRLDYDNNITQQKPGRHTIRSNDGWNLERIWEGVGTSYTKEQADANARLIAAAPELLQACKDAYEMLDRALAYFPKSIKHSDRFRLLNVTANIVLPAIAKAEGR